MPRPACWRRAWPWAVTIGGLVLAAAGVLVYTWVNRRPAEVDTRWSLPETLTPFNVLALLRGIERNNGFDAKSRQDLNHCIESIERFYFAGNGHGRGEPPNLRSVAEQWLARGR